MNYTFYCSDSTEQPEDSGHSQQGCDSNIDDNLQTSPFQKAASFALRTSGPDGNPQITLAAAIAASDQVLKNRKEFC